jgi:hypothetical protein
MKRLGVGRIECRFTSLVARSAKSGQLQMRREERDVIAKQDVKVSLVSQSEINRVRKLTRQEQTYRTPWRQPREDLSP